MDLVVYLLALLAGPAAPAPTGAAPGMHADGGGIPISPGPHQN